MRKCLTVPSIVYFCSVRNQLQTSSPGSTTSGHPCTFRVSNCLLYGMSDGVGVVGGRGAGQTADPWSGSACAGVFFRTGYKLYNLVIITVIEQIFYKFDLDSFRFKLIYII